MNDILIKDASLDDMSFFWSSILNHFRHSSPSTKLMTDAVFFGHHQPIVEAALKRKGNVLKFAALKDEPDVILGFLWGNEYPETVHYCYVKRAFRLMGIARALYEATFKDVPKVFYSHLTYDAGRITQEHKHFVYNPYLIHGDSWTRLQTQIDENPDALRKFYRPDPQRPVMRGESSPSELQITTFKT